MPRDSTCKNDDEAEKIRELIAECRENLNRIKCDAAANQKSTDSPMKTPCGGQSEERASLAKEGSRSSNCDPCAKYRNSAQSSSSKSSRLPCGSKPEDPCAKYLSDFPKKSPCDKRNEDGKKDSPCSEILAKMRAGRDKDPCESSTNELSSRIAVLSNTREKSRLCIDKIGEKMEREVKMKIFSVDFNQCAPQNTCECEESNNDSCSADSQDQVSCKVDLNQMKVNVSGCPEDLKKLDAVQLINLLDKFHCQELVISTGPYIRQEYCEVPIIYFAHPGNLVMIVGIAMVAYLVNANLCSPKRGNGTKCLMNLLYLGSFAFHYGMVLWMTFIRGLTLRARLSRDMFSTVDNLILPKYFSVCVLISAIALYSLLATHCTSPCTSWPLSVLVQVIITSATFLIELLAICYIVPAVIKLREATSDVTPEDFECGPPSGNLGKNLTKLAKLNWTISVINTLTLMFMGSSMYYITTKLNLG